MRRERPGDGASAQYAFLAGRIAGRQQGRWSQEDVQFASFAGVRVRDDMAERELRRLRQEYFA